MKKRDVKIACFLMLTALVISLLPSCQSKRMAVVMVEDPAEEAVSFVDEYGNVDYGDKSTWIIGFFERDTLIVYPHREWFYGEYDEYVPQSLYLNNLLDLRWDNVKVTIVMGTWCTDSRREVPRFMKIMDIIGFPDERINFIGTDIEKLSPVGGFEELEIERVPTFIFFVNNSEAGRIIEVPASSLEEDMLSILFTNK